MTFYPPIDEKMLWTLEVITKACGENGEYLTGAPYPDWVKQALSPSGTLSVLAKAEESMQDLDVPAELEELFRGLKTAKDELKASDSAEKIAYFRLATTLLEKLISLQERATNVRQVGKFHLAVLDVLTEHLDNNQITKVRDKLMSLSGGDVE